MVLYAEDRSRALCGIKRTPKPTKLNKTNLFLMKESTIIKTQLKQLLIDDIDSFFEVIRKDLSIESRAFDELILLENQRNNFLKSKRIGLLSIENEILRENQIIAKGIDIINAINVKDFSKDSLVNFNEEEILNAKDQAYGKLQKLFEEFANSSFDSIFGFFLNDLEQKNNFIDIEIEYIVKEFEYSKNLKKEIKKIESFQEKIEALACELDNKNKTILFQRFSGIAGWRLNVELLSKQDDLQDTDESPKSVKLQFLEFLIKFDEDFKKKEALFRKEIASAYYAFIKSGLNENYYKDYIKSKMNFIQWEVTSIYNHFYTINKKIDELERHTAM